MNKESRKDGKISLLGKLLVGGAVGSILAIALGTKKGRKKTQEIYENIKDKMEKDGPLDNEKENET